MGSHKESNESPGLKVLLAIISALAVIIAAAIGAGYKIIPGCKPPTHDGGLGGNVFDEETEAEPPDYGIIQLISELTGEVYIDGKHFGNIESGNVRTYPNQTIGTHRIEVRAGEETVTEQVEVAEEETSSVTISKPEDDAPMVLIPGGEFYMGSDDDDGDEKPKHTVYLDPFHIDTYEVTNKRYARFLNESDRDAEELLDIDDSKYCLIEKAGDTYKAKSGYEDHPVIEVNWYGAKAYAEYYGKRLPTEAEWEKAARGKLLGKKYPWGDGIDPTKANYDTPDGISRFPHSVLECLMPVGSFSPNGYGLYDMAGNVWEWCEDWYDDGYYAISVRKNPKGPNSGTNGRVVRGGSWLDGVSGPRVTARNSQSPEDTDATVGFRCVRDAKVQNQQK